MTDIESDNSERVQKVLARAGIGSRRQVESWIAAGRLTVDGRKVELGARITGKEKVCLDGRQLALRAETGTRLPKLIALNKPTGVMCTRRDPEGRRTVFPLLPKLSHGRWVSIGRLDINTSGLLLFTDDGELANRLMHPRYQIEREYAVRTLGQATQDAIKQLRAGIEIDGERYAFDDIVAGEQSGVNHWYYCVLRTGRNREVRRLWETVGLPVNRLMRTRFGNVILPRKVRTGSTFRVEQDDLRELCRAVGYRLPEPRGTRKRARADR